jgi:hypothetical protein
MKRYTINLGNFATYEEAFEFMELLIKNYASGWSPGEPTILDPREYIEEFELEE